MRVVTGALYWDLGLETGQKGLERQGRKIAQEQWAQQNTFGRERWAGIQAGFHKCTPHSQLMPSILLLGARASLEPAKSEPWIVSTSLGDLGGAGLCWRGILQGPPEALGGSPATAHL